MASLLISLGNPPNTSDPLENIIGNKNKRSGISGDVSNVNRFNTLNNTGHLLRVV
jgi:hypothetical protein